MFRVPKAKKPSSEKSSEGKKRPSRKSPIEKKEKVKSTAPQAAPKKRARKSPSSTVTLSTNDIRDRALANAKKVIAHTCIPLVEMIRENNPTMPRIEGLDVFKEYVQFFGEHWVDICLNTPKGDSTIIPAIFKMFVHSALDYGKITLPVGMIVQILFDSLLYGTEEPIKREVCLQLEATVLAYRQKVLFESRPPSSSPPTLDLTKFN